MEMVAYNTLGIADCHNMLIKRAHSVEVIRKNRGMLIRFIVGLNLEIRFVGTVEKGTHSWFSSHENCFRLLVVYLAEEHH